jgi:hypothetical protein
MDRATGQTILFEILQMRQEILDDRKTRELDNAGI